MQACVIHTNHEFMMGVILVKVLANDECSWVVENNPNQGISRSPPNWTMLSNWICSWKSNKLFSCFLESHYKYIYCMDNFHSIPWYFTEWRQTIQRLPTFKDCYTCCLDLKSLSKLEWQNCLFTTWENMNFINNFYMSIILFGVNKGISIIVMYWQWQELTTHWSFRTCIDTWEEMCS